MAAPSPTPPTSGRVLLVLLIAVAAVSLSAIFIRLAQAPGVVVASQRMLIAALLLAPITWRGVRRTPFTRKSLAFTVLAGVFLAIHFATWISSLSFTTVAASVTIVCSNPLWVALFSWLFLGKPPSLTMLMGVLLAVLGGAMIAFGDLTGGSAPLLGDALALVGALTVSAYLLLGRTAQREGLSLGAYAGSAYTISALLLLPVPALFGFPYLGYDAATYGWIFLLAALPQLVGHTGVNYAMKFLDPTLVTTVILLEPIGAALLALLLFAEVPGLLTVVGALVLLVGVLLTVRFGQSVPLPEATPAAE
ncbi:MAG TPA: DMT family transporter [Trueperaceae bacterium]